MQNQHLHIKYWNREQIQIHPQQNQKKKKKKKKKSSIIGAPRTEGEAAGLQLYTPNAKFKTTQIL